MEKLKLGDIVAIRDHYDFHGRGRYGGAITIGVCIHGFSESAGHGLLPIDPTPHIDLGWSAMRAFYPPSGKEIPLTERSITLQLDV